MRRFINSFGKFVSHVVAVSLLLPFVTLFALTRVEAQFALLPSWGVVEFVVKAPQGGKDFGQTAAQKVTNELTKTTKYDVIPVETVNRTAEGLGLQMPVTGLTSLVRLGQELHLNSIVTGEIANYRVVTSGSTKHADVIMRVIVTDVASGLAVNGAALVAHSTDRTGDVSDKTLVDEAIASGAYTAINEIQNKSLPTGTILNTLEKNALINQGSRSGFQNGQKVIVVRGREQVAAGTIYDVEPDQAYVQISRLIKGIQPGDRVRVIFSVPEIDQKWPKDNGSDSPVFKASKDRKPSTGFVQLLLLAGLFSILLGNGRASNDNIFTSVTAEAGLFVGSAPAPDPASGLPGVRVSWGTDLFIRGNSQKIQYQLFRIQGSQQLVNVIPGSISNGIDSVNPIDIQNYQSFNGVRGGSLCTVSTLGTGAAPTTEPTGVVLGQPYQYAVELVYHLNILDLPNPAGGGGPDCYFLSQQAFSSGFATPLGRPQLVFPNDQTTITGPLSFSFNSAQTSASPISVDYVIELSTTPTFAPGQTVAVDKFTKNTSGTIQTPNQINLTDTHSTVLPGYITSPNTTTIYWRVGARNTIDNPGPIPDAIGQRYVFSAYRTLTKPIPPPTPGVKR